MGIGKTTRIRSTEEAQRAAFAGIPVTPMPTTASKMAAGAITAMHSIAAQNPARPAPPVIMIMQIIPTLMASGQAPAKPSTSARRPAPSAKRPVKNTQTMWTRMATASATIAAQPLA